MRDLENRGNLVIINPAPRQPGMFRTFAGTAAGVAAGTVIGDKITGRNEAHPPASAPYADMQQPLGPCQYEEQQFLGCAQSQADVQLCESFRLAWMDCKRKHSTLCRLFDFYH